MVEGGESQVQHVAPREVGSGSVYKPDEDDDEPTERGRTLTCERYDETKICLLGASARFHRVGRTP